MGRADFLFKRIFKRMPLNVACAFNLIFFFLGIRLCLFFFIIIINMWNTQYFGGVNLE